MLSANENTIGSENKLLAALIPHLFILTYFVGGVGIVMLKMLKFHQFYVTATPVLCMLMYLGVLLYQIRSRVGDDRAPDNIYYLGLLYTLTSVGFVLFKFTVNGNTAEDIVQGFGIALITTILGLALRVFLIHLHGVDYTSEKMARHEFMRALQSMRDELSHVVSDLHQFRRETVQSTSDMTQEVTETVSKMLYNTTENLATSLTEILRNLDIFVNTHIKTFDEISGDAATKLSEGLTELKIGVLSTTKEVNSALETSRDLTKQLNKSSKTMVLAGEKLLSHIESIEVPKDILTSRMNDLFGSITKMLSENLTTNKSCVEEQQKLITELGKASTHLGDINTKIQILTGVGDSFQSLGTAISTTTKLMDTQNEVISKNVVSSVKLNEISISNAEIIRGHGSEIESELQKSRNSMTEIRQSLESLVNIIIEKLGNERHS